MSIVVTTERVQLVACVALLVVAVSSLVSNASRPAIGGEMASHAIPMHVAPHAQDEERSSAIEETPEFKKGAEVYRAQCASCHGASGEGGSDEVSEPLHGDRTLVELVRVIDETMPEDDPDACVAEGAEAVAFYVFHAFYSEEARRANQVPRIELSRLTVAQYRNALADLAGTFLGDSSIGDERGLRGEYYDARNFSRNKRKETRVDATIDFDFGGESPIPDKIGNGEFSMSWSGSVIAPDTGEYEFIVRSQNGIKLWVNGPVMLIDGWVNSGEQIVEHRESIYLVGGRSYPIRLQFFSFEDDAASIQLMWKPPTGIEEVIPQRAMAPDSGRVVFVASTPFPPDDSSVGYERGTSVSKLWDDATTNGAITFANFVVDSLDQFASTRDNEPDRAEKVQRFCEQFVERAFRRPVTDAERQLYVSRHFDAAIALEESVKRVVVLTLKSPHFLYLELGSDELTDYDIASRISFGLWDSLPDRELLNAASRGQLQNPDQVRRHVERMMRDPRTRAKTRQFFHQWLTIDESDEISKDVEIFQGFDERLVADLRTSLDLFIEQVVWGEASDYRELLQADYLYANERIASFYGLDFGEEAGFVAVTAPANTRAGVLTHPFLMATLAYHRSSSPIHRGVFVTRNILSRGLNPPPEDIEFLDDRFGDDLTMREKVTQLTEPAACQSCHRIINPLGFSLENYDAVGRYRTTEKEKPIDTTGVYEKPDGQAIELDDATDLAGLAIHDDDSLRGFVEQMFHHTMKQPIGAYGEDSLSILTDRFVAEDYHIRKLMVELMVVAALQPREAAELTDTNSE